MRRTIVASGAFLALAAGVAWTVSASFFVSASFDEFGRGKPTGIVNSEPGVLTLAAEKKDLLRVEGDYVWSIAVAPKGVVYAGTSDRGSVYRIEGDKFERAFQLEDDAAVFATAVGSDGRLYFGGSPTGQVYVDGKLFCRTEQSFVWALLFDDKQNLYAATGPDGKVFRIDRRGRATLVLDSPETHVMCLARDSKGNLYAGTSDKGLVYRIDAKGESQVIYDAAEGEVRALAIDEKDNVYIGTADVKAPGSGTRAPAGASRAARTVRTDASTGETTAAATPPPATPRVQRDDVTATNAVYRISPDGAVVQLYSVARKMVMSLLWHDGKLYVGTGNRGDLVAIDANLDATVLEKDMEGQVLCMAPGPQGALLLGTGDEGRLIRYAAGYVGEGEYVSEIFDAKFAARFGAVSWVADVPAGTQVELVTRTGNVDEPDSSWSSWSDPVAESGANVASPPARFIQYRVRLKTKNPQVTPRVDELRIAYLTGNQPPRVKSVSVEIPAQKPGATRNDAKIKVSWQAEDPNGDRMSYRVEFKRKDAADWRILEKETKDTNYAWDTDAVPDGRYEVRVTAGDSPSNPEATAVEHSRVSEVFLVDNTRPVVELVAKPGKGEATVEASLTDATGCLRDAEYALDSGEWKAAAPDDLIFDAKTEKVTILLKGLAPGEHTLTLRVSDDSSNIGAGSVTFEVK